MSSYTRIQLEKWLKTIDVKADRVLDIGGSQLSIKKRVNSFEAKDYKVLDLEEPHECKQKPDYIQDMNKVFECWKEGDIHYCNSFDKVFCIEVSEYWWNPIQALENIAALMKTGGELYISFHFVYPVHNPVEEDYIRYTRRGVEKMLEETGFKIDQIVPRKSASFSMNESRSDVETFYSNEKMRPSKGYGWHNEVGLLCKATKVSESTH